MVSTLVMICYIASVMPYVSSLTNLQELVNEILALLATYPLLVFTSYEWSQKYRIGIAWVLLSCIAVLILFNIAVYCYAFVKWVHLKCRVCHAKKKAKQLKLAAEGTATGSKLKADSQVQGMSEDHQARDNFI